MAFSFLFFVSPDKCPQPIKIEKPQAFAACGFYYCLYITLSTKQADGYKKNTSNKNKICQVLLNS